MLTIAFDTSKRTSVTHVLNHSGERIARRKLNNDPAEFHEFFTKLPDEPKRFVMEATRNWGLFHDTVREYVDDFLLGHPKKMKAITESSTKNDQNDAETMAQLAYSGFFPKAYVSSADTRQLRSILRFRCFMVKQRKAIRQQVHTLIDRNIWPCQKPQNFKDLFCRRGLIWLRSVNLPERERLILNECLSQFDALSKRIQSLERYINEQTEDLPGTQYLCLVPGFRVSKVHRALVLVETADISRFRKARHFAHYAGLIPKEHSSGDKHRTGGLVKDANMFLRTALIESTFAALRCDKGLKIYYKSVKARCGSGPAVVACARKLSYAIWHVLKERTAYRPHPLPPATACHSSTVSN